jgi:hypothetical protein
MVVTSKTPNTDRIMFGKTRRKFRSASNFKATKTTKSFN